MHRTIATSQARHRTAVAATLDGTFVTAQHAANAQVSADIGKTMALISSTLQPERRILHAGGAAYRAGDQFTELFILHAGMFKLVSHSADGREQVVGLKFRGDWLGFGGIAKTSHACDAVAMDTSEIWVIRYEALLKACATQPALMRTVYQAMSGEIIRDRDSMLSVCTLPADARVAEFLCYWADSLAQSGLRTDQITLRMTRAEIGNYLGMSLETVSRALSKLARLQLIAFTEKGRREMRIPDVRALDGFIHHCAMPAGSSTLQ